MSELEPKVNKLYKILNDGDSTITYDGHIINYKDGKVSSEQLQQRPGGWVRQVGTETIRGSKYVVTGVPVYDEENVLNPSSSEQALGEAVENITRELAYDEDISKVNYSCIKSHKVDGDKAVLQRELRWHFKAEGDHFIASLKGNDDGKYLMKLTADRQHYKAKKENPLGKTILGAASFLDKITGKNYEARAQEMLGPKEWDAGKFGELVQKVHLCISSKIGPQ